MSALVPLAVLGVWDRTLTGVAVAGADAGDRFPPPGTEQAPNFPGVTDDDQFVVHAYRAGDTEYPARHFVFRDAGAWLPPTLLAWRGGGLRLGWFQPSAAVPPLGDLVFGLTIGEQRAVLRVPPGAVAATLPAGGGLTHVSVPVEGGEAFRQASLPDGSYDYALRAGVDITEWVRAEPGVKMRHGVRLLGDGNLPSARTIVPTMLFGIDNDRTPPAVGAGVTVEASRTGLPLLRASGAVAHREEAPTLRLWRIEADGLMARVARASGLTVASQSGQRIDEAIGAVLDVAGITRRRLGQSSVVLEDWWVDPEESVLPSLSLLVRTDGPLARLYEERDGTIVFEPHEHRATAERSTALQRTFDGAAGSEIVVSGIPEADETEIVNSVRLNWQEPVSTGATSRLTVTGYDLTAPVANGPRPLGGIISTMTLNLSGYPFWNADGGPDDVLVVIGMVPVDNAGLLSPSGDGWRASGNGLFWRLFSRTEDSPVITMRRYSNDSISHQPYSWWLVQGAGSLLPLAELREGEAGSFALPNVALRRNEWAMVSLSWSGGTGGFTPFDPLWLNRTVFGGGFKDGADLRAGWVAMAAGPGGLPSQPNPLYDSQHPLSKQSAALVVVKSGARRLWSADSITLPAGGVLAVEAPSDAPYEAGSAWFQWRVTSGEIASVVKEEVSPRFVRATVTGSAGAVISGLTLYGVPGHYETATTQVENAASIARYGRRSRRLESAPYISAADAQALAERWVEYLSDPIPWCRARVVASQSDAALDAMLGLRVSDRVRVVEEGTGLDVTGFVEFIDEHVSGRGVSEFEFVVMGDHVAQQFRLDESRLNGLAVLG